VLADCQIAAAGVALVHFAAPDKGCGVQSNPSGTGECATPSVISMPPYAAMTTATTPRRRGRPNSAY
jgi:hypothetical protein